MEPRLSSNIELYPISTQNHFDNIINKLNQKINSKKDLTAIAKELETLLMQLKNLDSSSDPVCLAIKQRINTYLGFTSMDKLFRRSGGKLGWLTGDYFEREMTGLIQALVDYKRQQDTQRASYVKKEGSKHKRLSSPFLTGGVQGTVFLDTDFDAESILRQFEGSVPPHIARSIIDSKLNKNRYGGFAVPEVRDVKTDIRGRALGESLGVTIAWNPGQPMERLGQILTSYNFSLKSYNDLSSISLGHSNPFKAYAGVLSYLGYSSNAILESYLRIQCCYVNAVKFNNPKHSAHAQTISVGMSKIKSVFELIGLGITTLEGWKDEVDFLIVNQHSSDIIKVFSTGALAKKFLRRGEFQVKGSQNPFAQQSIKINVI